MEGAASQATTGTVHDSPLPDSSAPIQQAVETVEGSPNPDNSLPPQQAVDTVQGSLNGDNTPPAQQAAPPLLVQPINAVPPGAVIIYHVKQESWTRKRRGRPSIFPAARVDGEQTPGKGQSDKKQKREASSSSSGSAASNVFTAHTLNVEPGEEISSKIMALTHNGARAICVMSANGVISSVTLSQVATSGGTSTFEGRFDILSLRGTYLPSELAGRQTITGGLTVLLSAPDRGVLGGRLAGLLVAASPVQAAFFPRGVRKKVQVNPLAAHKSMELNLQAVHKSMKQNQLAVHKSLKRNPQAVHKSVKRNPQAVHKFMKGNPQAAREYMIAKPRWQQVFSPSFLY